MPLEMTPKPSVMADRQQCYESTFVPFTHSTRIRSSIFMTDSWRLQKMVFRVRIEECNVDKYSSSGGGT